MEPLGEAVIAVTNQNQGLELTVL